MTCRFWLICGWLFLTQMPFAQSTEYRYYRVREKDTPSSVAATLGLQTADLWRMNPEAKTNWKPGLTLQIIQSPAPVKPTTQLLVKAHDTWFGLSKQCGCTVEALQQYNPEAKVQGLQPGMVLRCKPDRASQSTPLTPTQSVPLVKATSNAKTTQSKLTHIVQAHETWYSIAKAYQLDLLQLQAANPLCPVVLPLGYELQIPSTNTNLPTRSTEALRSKASIQRDTVKPQITSLEPFTLCLALPLHLYKKGQDSTETVTDRLKKDKLLNVALDFYNGALKAVDSAKTLGYPVRLKIIDSEETKNGSSWAKWQDDGLWDSNTVLIGPFFQQHAQAWAAGLQDKKIPVYSPLSKETASAHDNLFQTQSNEAQQRQQLLQFINQQDARVVVLADPKKNSVRAALKSFEKWAWVGLGDKGNVVVDSLRSKLLKAKTNYIVLATEKTSHVVGVLRAMKALSKEYNLKLASVEASETLEFDEVPMELLYQFQLIIPQNRRINTSVEFDKFKIAFRKTYKVIPNEIAIRGFDVVFDVIERRVKQWNPQTPTERWENHFEYRQNTDGSWENQGVYLWQFQADGNPKMLRP